MQGIRRFVLLVALGVFGVSSFWALRPVAALATVSGPCTATLAGVPITSGHDSASTAVHVDYHDDIPYDGRSTNGQEVAQFQVSLQILGYTARSQRGSANGTSWSSTASIAKYAWAGVGLYRVTGTAFATGGAPLCSGVAYVCVDGKSPFLTAAGIAAVVAGLIGLWTVFRGLAGRKGRRASRAARASRLGIGGLFLGVSAPILLQQTCVLPLTPAVAIGSVGGGILVLALVGAMLSPKRPAAASASTASATAPATSPPAAVATAPTSREERAPHVLYRFVPSDKACAACQSHAAHRTYRTMEAIDTDRAHPACTCQIAPTPSNEEDFVARFAGGTRDVFDDRKL